MPSPDLLCSMAGRLSKKLRGYLTFNRRYHPHSSVFWDLFDITHFLVGGFGHRFVGHRTVFQRMLGLDAAYESLTMPGGDHLLLRRNHRGVIRDIFDREVYGRWRLDPGADVLDGGAHWGAFTLWASRRVGPKGHVLAVEPDPDNFRELQRNVARNRLDNVTLVQAGLWDSRGEGGLPSVRRTGAAGMESLDPSGSGIALVTIDELLERRPMRNLRLLKLDIEGAEFRALRGASTTLGRGPDIAMEVHPEETDADAVEGILREKGYGLTSNREAGRSDAYLLWARRGEARNGRTSAPVTADRSGGSGTSPRG